MKVMFIPFFQPSFDDEEEEVVLVGKKKKKKAVVMPSARSVTSHVSPKLKVGLRAMGHSFSHFKI